MADEPDSSASDPQVSSNGLPDILTVAQAAQYLQISRSALYKLVEANEVPFKRLGSGKKGTIRFSKERLFEWVKGNDD